MWAKWTFKPYILVGPPVIRLVPDSLAVLSLHNHLCIPETVIGTLAGQIVGQSILRLITAYSKYDFHKFYLKIKKKIWLDYFNFYGWGKPRGLSEVKILNSVEKIKSRRQKTSNDYIAGNCSF